MDRTLILVKPDAFARGPQRRDHRPLRAQGPEDRRAAPHDRDAGAGRAPLRRARRAAVLRRARRLHHLRPDRGDGARGPRGGQGRAPGDRRDQPAGGRAGQRSAATSRSRWATNMVHGSDSPESAAREAALFFGELLSPSERRVGAQPLRRPRLVASPQRRAILERLGVDLQRAGLGRAGARATGEPGGGGARERAAQGARGAQRPRARARRCSAATRSWCSTARSTASPPTSARRRATLRALGGRTHEVLSGLAVLLGGRGAHGARAHRRSRFRALDEELLDWYVATRRVARALRRLRDPGRRRGARAARSRAKYENVVGLPLAALLDLCARSCCSVRPRSAQSLRNSLHKPASHAACGEARQASARLRPGCAR